MLEIKKDAEDILENENLVKIIEEYQKTDDREKNIEQLSEIFTNITEKAEFLIPVRINIELENNQEKVVSDPDAISIVLVTGENDERYIPVFSSWDEINKAQELKNFSNDKENERAVIRLNFKEIIKVLKSDSFIKGIVINMNSLGFILRSETLLDLDEKSRIYGDVEKISLKLLDSNEFPVDFISSVKKAGKNIESINRIFLRNILRDGEKRILMIIDFGGEERDIIKKLSQEEILLKDKTDIAPLADFSMELVKGIEPIYLKKDISYLN